MRVTIDHVDVRRGFPFRRTYYEVALTVAFTHEEKQIITQRRLESTPLLRRRPATARVSDRDEQFALYVGDLLHGQTDRFLCATPSKAKIYHEQVLAALADVKLWLEDNGETGTRTVTEF